MFTACRYIAAANSNVRLSDVSLFDSTTGRCEAKVKRFGRLAGLYEDGHAHGADSRLRDLSGRQDAASIGF